MMNIANEVLSAESRIREHILQTPLYFSLALSQYTQTNVYLKCENLQYTGAFKVRGAFNKLLSLTSSQRVQGVVAASSGNHGAAVAYGMHKLKIRGKIFVPENASLTKIDNIRNYNVPLELHGLDCIETERTARGYAQIHNMIYISPYNDIQVIAGQGTLSVELARQLEKTDAIFVPVGGGGLISGIAGYIKAISPSTRIIGCLPEKSPVMSESQKAGKIIESETFATLSDATAGGIELDSITFELCEKWVDDYVLVSEQEIKSAIITLIKTQHLLIEGAAGLALASIFKVADQFQGKNVVVVLSGSNISLDTLKNVLS